MFTILVLPDLHLHHWHAARHDPIVHLSEGRQRFGSGGKRAEGTAGRVAQFLGDSAIVQQAYATAEPLYAADEGASVDTYVLADYGWSTYSSTVETRRDLVENNPDLVQRFVDASIIGWYNFLYGDRTAAHEMIMRDNPDQSVEKLDREVGQLMALDIIDSGNAADFGNSGQRFH